MGRLLDFSQAKKQYLTVAFVDGQKILVKTPTKKIMDALVGLSESFTAVEEEINLETIKDIYVMCATIMSNNLGSKLISDDYLSEVLDFEDMLLFFNEYMGFVGSLKEIKN